MTDFPEDILKAVDRVIADLKGRADSIEEDAEAVLADAFARAIRSERQRCEKIAYTMSVAEHSHEAAGALFKAYRAIREEG